MPLISAEEYIPRGLYRHGHYNTIVTSTMTSHPVISWRRERVETPDDDFIDIDCVTGGYARTIVLCHGLEGSSDSGYIRLFADHFVRQGWDVVAINYRGCSGEMNRQLLMYNSGTTHDLHHIIQHISDRYDVIVPIGFSLGGNLVLKYLGEQQYDISPKVKCGTAISAPVDLSNASQQLLRWENALYQIRFLKTLRQKVRDKKKQYPNDVTIHPFWRCYNLYQFDDLYTGPMFGYRDAKDYYAHCASIQFIPTLERPALLLNAVDDPFLGDRCYPAHLSSETFSYCESRYGGHCGFSTDKNDRSWLPQKVETYVNSQL